MKPTGLPKAARLLIALSTALVAVIAAVASSAHASVTPTATATLTAGSPSIVQPTSTISIAGTLDGAATDYFSDNGSTDQLEILNPGNPTGWNVTAWATAFTCEGASTCGSDTFNGLSITKDAASGWTVSSAPTMSCVGSCILPTNATNSTVGWGTNVYSATSTPTTLYQDDANKGIGKVKFTTEWWIAVPANVQEGAYDSTVTLNIAANGP